MSLKSRNRSRGGSLSSPSGGYYMTYKDYMDNVAENSVPGSTHTSTFSSYDGESISDYICYSPGSLVKHGVYPNTLKNADPSYKEVVHRKRKTTRTTGPGFKFVHPNPAPYRYAIFERIGGTYVGDRLVPSDPWSSHTTYGCDPRAVVYGGTSRVPHSTVLTHMREMLNDNNLLGFDDFSLTQFVVELKDIRRLLDLFKVKYGNDRDLSDKILNVEFGHLPIIKDVQSIFKRLNKLPSAIEAWNEIAARSGTMNIHRVLDSDTQTINYTSESGGYTYGPIQYKSGYVLRGTVTTKLIASIYFRPLPVMEDSYFTLYRNIWGIDRIFSILWDLYPFSFVFDWFIDIGEAIDQFERSSPVLRTTILAAGYSVKQSFNTVGQEYMTVNGTKYDQDTVTCSASNYIRTPVSATSIIEAGKYYNFGRYLGEIGTYQASISSLLLHQHFRS